MSRFLPRLPERLFLNIEKYLKSVNVLDKAGAYAAQECGSMIIEAIDGNFDNVMGLPCGLVKKMLKEF